MLICAAAAPVRAVARASMADAETMPLGTGPLTSVAKGQQNSLLSCCPICAVGRIYTVTRP
ncbi:hypothetical protein F1D61_04065 [Methylobacterium aquaticum]|nr:hypothetical protein F1D61_04065 [Methylobacterium aquaticum]